MIGEIRGFAGNFAPKNWAFCQGQIINIASNTALFSILGTTYGGNGTTTFGLPNLAGRVAIGAGQGPGLPNVTLGQTAGSIGVTLNSTQMPMHTHMAIQSGVATTMASSGDATLATAAPGSVLATPGTLSGRTFTATLGYNANQPDITLASGAVNTSGMSYVNSPMGGNQPHENRQPYLGMNYVICMYGIFPSRG